jgi:glycosyltransferase involved in cell wall biosynthesis
MNIAILHYHLRTGGVTTVIRRQVEALGPACRVIVITGEAPADDFPCDTHVIPSLAYDVDRMDNHGPDETARSLEQLLKRVFPEGCDILHIHNPTIGKNRHLIPVIARLRDAGHGLFLQIHDFAEDGRPHLYTEAPYPIDCHYGVINRRDLGFLLAAGILEDGCHYIPNAVSAMPAAGSGAGPQNDVLYPVRAIRRKNIGEAILLSKYLPGNARILITRPPHSQADLNAYRQWRRLASAVNADILFEAARDRTYEELVAGASAVLTTSISEGFGFVFLEPWTAGKFLFGRSLRAMAADSAETGVDLTHLYPELAIPLAWIDDRQLITLWERAISRVCETTGAAASVEGLRSGLHGLLSKSTIDFGLLHESLQLPVVKRVFNDPAAADRLRRENPFLNAPFYTSRGDRVQHNRAAITAHYSLSVYRERLLRIYRRVMRTPVSQRIHRQRLLAAFLTVDNFSLLKWLAYDP